MSDKGRMGFVRRRLGRTGLMVSEVSLGTWTLGGVSFNEGSPNGWGALDVSEAERAVLHALDLGCNHLDTADVYGAGRSEQLLGRVLGARRKEVVLATKVGWFRGTAGHAYQPLHIRHQLEQSLANLRTDHVDIYYFHHGDFGESDLWLDGAIEVMRRLKEEGKVRFIGQSAYTQADFEKLIPRVDPDVLQSSTHMLNLKMIGPASRIPALIAQRDLGLVGFSPMAQGLLLDKYDPKHPPQFEPGDQRAGSRWFKADFLERMQPRLAELKKRFGGSTAELVRASLQYVLAYPSVSCVIPGFRNCAQVEMDLSAAGQPLTTEDREWIRELFADLALTD
ncbi:aldo/keto reductase [bacterium]|nr:aldo/keto reductase [bacterium]